MSFWPGHCVRAKVILPSRVRIDDAALERIKSLRIALELCVIYLDVSTHPHETFEGVGNARSRDASTLSMEAVRICNKS